MPMLSGWNDEKITLLKTLWLEKGLTAERISQIMRVSRSSVLGKVHRLKLPPRAAVQQRRPTKKRRPFNPGVFRTSSVRVPCSGQRILPGAKSAVHEIHVDDLALLEVGCKTLVELEAEDCRWPIGDPQSDEFRFCGRERIPGKPYCKPHVLRSVEAPVVPARADPHVEPVVTPEPVMEPA